MSVRDRTAPASGGGRATGGPCGAWSLLFFVLDDVVVAVVTGVTGVASSSLDVRQVEMANFIPFLIHSTLSIRRVGSSFRGFESRDHRHKDAVAADESVVSGAGRGDNAEDIGEVRI